MKNGVHRIKLLSLIIMSIILPGCTMAYISYFRNYSDKPVELIFEISDYYREHNYPVRYKNEILPITKKTYNNLDDSLQITILPHNKALLTIPPNSTVSFPRWGFVESGTIYLKQENKFDSIATWNHNNTTKQFLYKKQGFPVSILYYYDYK